MRVHRRLGPGLLESVYETCVAYELRKRGRLVRTQVPVPIIYDDVRLDVGFRMDLLVDHVVLVELKAVTKIAPIHEVQTLTYLRLSARSVGLLIDFHEPHLRDGIRRVVN